MCVPDHTAARVGIAGLALRLAGLKLPHRGMDGAELLVARHLFHQPAFVRVPNGKVADQVEQVRGAQHAGHEHFLAGQAGSLSHLT